MLREDGAYAGSVAAACAVVRAPPPDELSAVLAKFPGIPYQVRMHRCKRHAINTCTA